MKKTIAIAVTALMLATVIGCAKAPSEPLSVAALKGPTGMGLAYVMQDHADAYQVEIFDAPDVVTAKFISGDVDIAAVPVNLASVLYNKTGGDAVVIAVNTLGVLYVTEQGDGVQSFSDLSGKKIYASGQGSTPEYVLNYLLQSNGILDAEIEYVGEHAALATMAAAGEAQLSMLPEPNVSAVLMKNENVRVALNLSDEWEKVTGTQLVQGCYIVRKAVYNDNKAQVDAFIQAVESSVQQVNTNASAPALIAELGIVPSEAIAKSAIPRCNIVCLTGEDMVTAMNNMLSVLLAANPASVGGSLPGADFYAG